MTSKEIVKVSSKAVVPAVNEKSKISPVAPVLPPFNTREDRVGKYFTKHLKKFRFAEFSDAYIAKVGNFEFMKGVPIPLREEDFETFGGGEGIKSTHLAENISWVLGADPNFKYNDRYVAFMNRLFNAKILEGLLKKGRDAAEEEEFDEAAILFRAILMLKPDYIHAMYSYARVCREFYLRGSGNQYKADFKKESMDYFEMLTTVHPRFAQAYYYLGYDYLNLGLYQKAELVWQDFIKKSSNNKDRSEIKKRIKQLEEPIKIEKGYNEVLAGRWESGLEILEPFADSNFKDWWPLHYYLGVAYARLGRNGKALDSFKKVLGFNATHVETMEELVKLYALSKDKENEKKYKNKIDLILTEDEKAARAKTAAQEEKAAKAADKDKAAGKAKEPEKTKEAEKTNKRERVRLK